MKQRILYIVALSALVLLLAACGAPRVELSPIPEHSGIGVVVISAAEWFDEHPEVVTSYLRNDRNEHYSYLERNP